MKLIDKIRADVRAALDDRAAKQAELDAIITAAEARSDTNLTADEDAAFAAIRAALTDIDARVAALNERKALLEETEAAAAAAANIRKEVGTFEPQLKGSKAERAYSPDAEQRGISFLRDVMNAQLHGDFDARDRLARHIQEDRVDRAGTERRDVGTSAFAGLTVPQYLTGLVAEDAKASRPFANICASHPLPASGMTVNISRITTSSATAVQATENSAVQETNMDDTLLTVDVRTIAGQQDVSRQAVERGTGIDAVVVADLIGEYHTEVDRGILNDDGTSGTHLGVRNVSGNIAVTYTDASPSAAELYPKLADLIQQMQTGMLNKGGLTHFVMHPRRWWWLSKELSSTFPLLTIPSASGQQAGQLGGTDYLGTGRSILGVPVILDANLPTNLGGGTNEDPIIGVCARECHLWEDGSPLLIRAEQTGVASLTVKFVVYGYSAFTAGRYASATGDITGTGLVTPTF